MFDKIRNGSPQDSVLGPLVVLRYSKRLPQVHPGVMQSVCVLMTIILQFLVNPQTLRKHQNYFDIKELLMNVSKSNFISFVSTKNREINKNKIYFTQEISHSKRKYISGINNKSKFSWDKHVDRILNKISPGIWQ